MLLNADGNPDEPIAEATGVNPAFTTITFDGFSLPHLFVYEVRVRCRTDANLWSERTSERVTIDLTRPHTRQVIDLAAAPTEGTLAAVPPPGSDLARGFATPAFLTPSQVARVDLDFVVSLSRLRVGFAAWDEDSGIKHVMVAVGPAPGSPAILKWTPIKVDGVRHVTATLPPGVPLIRHMRYYVSVSAVNVSVARACVGGLEGAHLTPSCRRYCCCCCCCSCALCRVPACWRCGRRATAL